MGYKCSHIYSEPFQNQCYNYLESCFQLWSPKC